MEHEYMRDLCERVLNLVAFDRQSDYGCANRSFGRIAALWSALLGIEITAPQVAGMMILLKASRLEGSGWRHEDSWLDLMGYALLGADLARTESAE